MYNLRTVFCKFLDSQDKDGAIKFKPLEKAKVPKWVKRLIF